MPNLIELHVVWLRASGASQTTIDSRRRLLRHADQSESLPHGLDQANADELAAYLATPGWSAWTLYTYHGHLAGFYRWGVMSGHLTLDPMAFLRRPRQGDQLPDPATDDELAQALALLPEQPWRMAVRLAAYAGLRCCEIVTARREHCTPDWMRIRGKGGRWQTVPMASPLWAEVEPRPPGLLVRSVTGLAMTAQGLSQAQGPAWLRIGQPHQHLHRFRHWLATTLLQQGHDIREVQEIMRHRSIQSTQGYTAVAPVRILAAVRGLPFLG